MGSKVKQMDEYVCAEMIKSDIELNYDNFYKDDLIRLLKVCRKLYKEVQEINEETIDEAPFVYKPMKEIIDCIGDTVEIEKIIKPIYNFKASE